jgi:hypothetical protein
MISWLILSWTNSFRQAIHTGTCFLELFIFLILWWTTFFDMLCCWSCSVNEGYLTYTKFRALQHFSSAMLHVLSTQVNFLVAVIFYLVIRFLDLWQFVYCLNCSSFFFCTITLVDGEIVSFNWLPMWAVAQSLLFAAGLRPTPAQATAVSWVSIYRQRC